MAGDNQGEGIFCKRVSNGPAGAGIANHTGQLRIGDGFAERDFSARGEHFLAESRAVGKVKGFVKPNRFSFKIGDYFVLQGS